MTLCQALCSLQVITQLVTWLSADFKTTKLNDFNKIICLHAIKWFHVFLSNTIIWKSDLTDKMKCMHGCTTWTLTKRPEKKLDGNYTRILRAILNKSWWQHPTRCQLYGHLPPIMKTIEVRQTWHAGYCWRSRDELISDVLLWTPTYGQAKAERPARAYIQQLCEDVALKTCQRRWTIGKSGERGSGISVLVAWHDDDLTLIILFNIIHLFAHS